MAKEVAKALHDVDSKFRENMDVADYIPDAWAAINAIKQALNKRKE